MHTQEEIYKNMLLGDDMLSNLFFLIFCIYLIEYISFILYI